MKKKTGLCITSSLSRTDSEGNLYLSALNLQTNEITIPRNSDIALFEFLSPQQAEALIPLEPQLLTLAKFKNPDDFEKEINQLIIDEEFNADSQPPRPKPDYKRFWFPTPETCKNPTALKGVEKRIYNELEKLRQLDSIDPHINDEHRNQFLQRLKWNESILKVDEKQQVEDLLIEFSYIFAKYRFDVGYNSEISMKLTPEHDQPVYTQSPPTPIHLREELQVELALLQYFGIITSLNHSKYSSAISAHRKPNGELRILVDLRRINHLLLHDYQNNNFPISTMADTTAHFAGKSIFCKLDCSQAYHCVQMADPLSVQLLAFNFASRTMAYQRLARGLNRSVTGFTAFVRNYLEPCLSANICTQLMDDIGSGAESVEQLIPNLRPIFKCLRRSGLKLSPEKCVFGSEKVSFLGNVITKEGLRPEKDKIENFLRNLEIPKSVKQVKRLIGFIQFFRSFIPNLNEHLIPFYKLLRKNVSFEITDEIENAFKVLRDKLQTTTTQTLRLAKPGLQYAILCDASYHSSGFVLMIEDYVNNNKGETVKSYAPVSFGSKVFNTAQLKMSIYCKEFLSLYFALETFSYFIWGCEKPVLILTDNKSLTRFFQAKTFNYDFVESLRDEMLKKFQNTKESLAKSFNRYRRYYDQKARANPLTEHTYCLLLNPRLTEQSAFSPKLIQKWLALYRVERVLTAANYLIRKTGTNCTQIVHRIRLRPIKPQCQVTDIEDINPENFQTDPTLGCYRGDQDFFDNGLPYLLDNDQGAPEKKIPNLDSPGRVSISFGAQPPQPLPAQIVNQPDAAAVTAEPASIHQAPRAEQPRRILTPPAYLTAQLPDSSEESDEYAENNTAPRRSARIQEQQTKRLGERVLEVAGQQLQQTRSSKRTNHDNQYKPETLNLLNNRRQQRQQMQFVQRLGATQEGTTSKNSRTDLNEIQAPKKTSQVTIVEDNLFGTSSSMGHCVSSVFFMGAGIAKRFDRLYPKMKREAC